MKVPSGVVLPVGKVAESGLSGRSFLFAGVPVSVQRPSVTLKNGLFLRFHLFAPDVGCFCRGWRLPKSYPFVKCDFPDFFCSVGLPETSAISFIGPSALPICGTLNLLGRLIHNGHEVFGCRCSLYCWMFEASPQYSVESLSHGKDACLVCVR